MNMVETGDQVEEPDIIVGSREQLLYLLAEAAEIEHALMCSYLYAAFSLKRAGEAGLNDQQGAAVERWRKAIIDVAVEEMGHLVLVSNLTVAIGGQPHFARPNFPVATGYFPSGVAVRLTPFNSETLEHFIFLERPQGLEGEDSAAFVQINYQREQARPGLMPSAQDYETIGHLYEAIRTNFVALYRQLGREALFLGRAEGQLFGDTVAMAGLDAITDLKSALAAIDIVVEQGEGSPTDRDVSHYRSFLTIQEELAQFTRDNPAFEPAWPVADSPVLRRPPEPQGKVFVDNPEAAVMLDFACATYGVLLRCLVQCFGRSGSDVKRQQGILMSAAFELMHVLGDAASRLARLPAAKENTGVHAGMTFTMLRGVEPLLQGSAERCQLVERLAALKSVKFDIGEAGRAGLERAAEVLAKL